MDNAVYNNIKEDEPVDVGVPQVATGGAIISPNGSIVKGASTVNPSKQSFTGLNQLSVAPGDSIQDAINALDAAGGGTLYLQRGTHRPISAINVKSAIQFVGENQTTTFIDFGNTAAKFTLAGTDVYAVGTITSITSGVNVTGSGTSWLANLTTDHQIFIANVWYKIAAVLTDTTLTLAEGYQGNATLPGSAYRAAKIVRDVEFSELTLQNSTSTAIDMTDIRNVNFNGLTFLTNNKGFTATNVYQFTPEECEVVSSTSNGIEITNARFFNATNVSASSNGGHGVVLNNITVGTYINSSATSNTSDGFNITSCTDLVMSPIEASANGGQGVECVSGNSNLRIDGKFNANTSDGIKLTATSDDCRFHVSEITNNGGYGINIAASSCDNNIISNNVFSGNTTANHNDSGTGTVIRGNVGVSDNTTSGNGKFGGDGSDGALSISSGTTTIDLGGAAIVDKNYTSISITGTGKLAFSNPASTGTLLCIRSQGNITFTSSTTPNIDGSGIGAAGGTGATDGSAATDGTTAAEVLDTSSHYGGLGSNGAGAGTRGAGGSAGGAATNLFFYTTTQQRLCRKALFSIVGSGGGGGGRGDTTANNGSNGGAGGRGGGALLIECGGAFNFTGTIYVSGAAGSNASNATGAAGAGGGGGSGGSCIILYNTLTANTGTITSSGGSGGSGGTGGGGGSGIGGGGGGGGGGGHAGVGTAGTGGGVTFNGGAGGAGANGFSLVAENTEFS